MLNYKPGISHLPIIPVLGSQNRRILISKPNWTKQQAAFSLAFFFSSIIQ